MWAGLRFSCLPGQHNLFYIKMKKKGINIMMDHLANPRNVNYVSEIHFNP